METSIHQRRSEHKKEERELQVKRAPKAKTETRAPLDEKGTQDFLA